MADPSKSFIRASDRRIALVCLGVLAAISVVGLWAHEAPVQKGGPVERSEDVTDRVRVFELEPDAPSLRSASPAPTPHPTLALRGKVVTGNGQLVPGASLSLLDGSQELLAGRRCLCEDHCGAVLLQSECSEASRQLARIALEHTGEAPMVARAVSGPDGSFEFSGLSSGSYELWAESAEHGVGMAQELSPGGEPVEVAVMRETVLTGEVLDEDGEPLAGAVVTAISGEHRRHLSTNTGLDGRFTIGALPYAEHVVVATLDGKVPAHAQASAGDAVKLVLKGERRIVGRVTIRGQGLAGAQVKLKGERHADEVSTDRAGRFVFGNLLPGSYKLKGTGFGLFQGETSVQIQAGVPTPEVELRLEEGAEIFGDVIGEDGAPLAEAKVDFSGSQDDVVSTVGTDAEGRFETGALMPGVYSVSASAAGYVLSEAVTLTLQAGDRRSVELRLRKAALMKGVVLNESGEPIDGADVYVSQHGPAGWGEGEVRSGGFISTDLEGKFELMNFPPGKYELRVAAYGYTALTQVIDAPAQGLSFKLARDPDFEGGRRMLRLQLIQIIRSSADREKESLETPGEHDE